jgi:hypothetical protein
MLESRRDLISKAVIDCLDEMYRTSQPSITWEEVEAEAKLNPEKRIWEEHYLSAKKFEEIQDKYLSMYRIGDEFKSDVTLVEEYLSKGGTRDKYIPEVIEEDGFKHPGYRGYEAVPPIKEQIEKILNDELVSGEVSPFVKDAIRDKIVESVMNTIADCKEFYCFNREEIGFRFNVSNYSPNSNIEIVKEIYKDTDIVINEDIEDEEYED